MCMYKYIYTLQHIIIVFVVQEEIATSKDCYEFLRGSRKDPQVVLLFFWGLSKECVYMYIRNTFISGLCRYGTRDTASVHRM